MVSIIIIKITLTKSIAWRGKIGSKIKREIQKFGFRVAFQTDPNLNNILCKNKDKLIPNSYPVVIGIIPNSYSYSYSYNSN